MRIKEKYWIELGAIALISALIYLSEINNLSYFRDDWYYAYDGLIAGPSIFKVMFSSDRPARGIFFGIYYSLFGSQPLPYHIGIYIWRLLGAYAALWIFHLLWTHQRFKNFAMALLFMIYPGFLWWPAGIEYQPMVASLCLHTFSIALTLKAIKSTGQVNQLFLWVASILSGLVAIALVDYAIGIEVFRILCILLLVIDTRPVLLVKQNVALTIRALVIPLTIPISFLIWKMFIFTGDRKATDIGIQISTLISSPLETTLSWSNQLLTSTLNVLVLAWGTPLIEYINLIKDGNILPAVLVTVLATILAFVVLNHLHIQTSNQFADSRSDYNDFSQSAVWLGLFGTIFGLLPIIMANRFVAFGAYSHYALPASLPATILLIGAGSFLQPKKLQIIFISLFVGIAALTHQAVAINAATEQAKIREFWWQVYWRIPKIQEGTLLAVHYPSINYGTGYGEDIEIVFGPANFLFYPQPQPGVDIVSYPLGATLLDEQGIQYIVDGKEKRSKPYRSHTMFLNYRRTLVMSQPSTSSCVHVIDPRWIERSKYDPEQIAQLFPHSKIEFALTVNENTTPPQKFAFGIEPAHNWCYYYQKAELARQNGDWEAVAALGKEATSFGLAPVDPIEWTPFLQAYAYLGQVDELKQLSTYFEEDVLYNPSVCKNINGLNHQGFPLQPNVQATVNNLFCKQ
jgi:hypothetical protein